ncbi:hypothetical protein QCA50_015795 [Cerrena zonata]|uniref:ABC transporter domain-containing protein n=1 Tax=Cerrena zonata TaxID=2478898 RepID=A0AAW0FID5_9APHY
MEELDLQLFKDLNKPKEAPLHLFETGQPKIPPPVTPQPTNSNGNAVPLHYQKRNSHVGNLPSSGSTDASSSKDKKRSKLKKLFNAELQSDAVIRGPSVQNGGVAVSIKNGTFLWSKPKDEENFKVALSNINLKVKKGELDCIVGRVGSDGEVKVNGKVAYVPQVPWIMNATVKDNVLFGHKFDAQFYDRVLKACALNIDLKILPKGDKTEVGEKGISLSGGQKARLSLARAVYARADVYLLDDPLSAVDEHVGKHLISHVLGQNGLLKSKCKILATNSIGVLSIADNLHMVKDGKLVEQGTYDDIMKQEKSQLRQLIKDFGKKRDNSGTATPMSATSSVRKEGSENPSEIDFSNLESDSDLDVSSLRRASDASLVPDEELGEEEEEDEDTKARKEHMEQGQVKWDVYKAYAQACNPYNICMFLGTTVTSSGIGVLSNIWLKHWSEVNSQYGYNPHVVKYLGIYFLLGIAFSASAFTNSVFIIMEYSSLTPEAPEIIESNRPPTEWPEAGEVKFNNYSTKYRPELDLVLKNINVAIKSNEKIGIVGRTGADEQLWKALELSHLKSHVIKMFDERSNNEENDIQSALDVKLSEGGSNLSVGQRQLMCLARALLIPSHILVLDEATAAVDVETDQILQETIRTEFSNRTVLTIAHRLNTIMHSDRIIVLEQGEIAEFDSPANLLSRKESMFYALCKEGGLVEND